MFNIGITDTARKITGVLPHLLGGPTEPNTNNSSNTNNGNIPSGQVSRYTDIPELNERVMKFTNDRVDINNFLEDINQRGGFDSAFYAGIRSGSLNKDEFIALQMYKAETDRLRQSFEADGSLTNQEKQILKEREENLVRLYQKYISGDYHPKYQVGGMGEDGSTKSQSIDKEIMKLYGDMFDKTANRELTKEEFSHLNKKFEKFSELRGKYGEEAMEEKNVAQKLANYYNDYTKNKNKW